MSPSERSPGTVPYRKLPGDFRGFFRRNTLWLGPDHLLQVDSTRFSETYKRFYLPDIQTIIIRKTPRFVLPYYWALLTLAALIFLLAGVAPFRQGIFWPSIAVLSAVVLYLYIASMFQSCTCHLITRVSRVELASLFRLRSARQFADLMAQRIANVQGSLPDGWVERATNLVELSTAADRNPDTVVDVLPAGTFSWLPVVVFVLVLADAALTSLQLRNPALPLTAPNVIDMIALAVCATISVVRLTRQKGSTVLRRLVLAGLFSVAGATYGGLLLQSIDVQIYHKTFPGVFDYPGMRVLQIVGIVVDIAVAITGLVIAFRQSSPGAPKSTSLFGPGVPPT